MTHPTKRRTVSREAFEAARQAWTDGEFSDEWKPWRHLAAMEAGIIAPPDGTKWDQWDDENPSERALLIRAIRETPDSLRRALRTPGVHAWSNVVAILMRRRDELRDDLEQDERDADRRRRDQATPSQATYVLRQVLDIIGQS
jgi:hypothetical protein